VAMWGGPRRWEEGKWDKKRGERHKRRERGRMFIV